MAGSCERVEGAETPSGIPYMQRLRNRLFGPSLGGRTFAGGAVLLAGELYSNGIRLVSNLVMTRLLFPEAFGVMLVVNLVFSALSMLSDVGIRSAVIARKEGVDARFLNIAWSIQIIRGCCLAVIAALLAKPMATWYDHDQLFELIMVASLAPIIGGFASPFRMVSERNIKFGRVAVYQASHQTLATIVTITWLLISPSIWALAAHGIASAIFAVILSHTMFPQHKPRMQWDSAIARELFHFGKWIMLGTALTFMGRQGDSLIVSRFLNFEMLGVFSIAVSLAKLIEMIAEKLSWGLLFPVYSEMKQGTQADFASRSYKLRLAMYACCFPGVIVLSVFGRDVIQLLYDPRYHEAGWMLEVLSLGLGFYILAAAVNSLPLAHEDSKRHMWLQFMRVVSVLTAMLVGGWFFGNIGLIWGVAVGQVVYYPLLQMGTRGYGVTSYGLDVAVSGVVVLIVMGIWSIRGWPGPGVG